MKQLLRPRLASSMLVLMVVAGCAHEPQPASKSDAPIVDHHQHLLSIATADQISPPPLAPIALPQELARLLSQRAQHWNDPAMLAQLYINDAVALGTESPGWIRGQAAIAAYFSARFARAYEMTAVEYRAAGAAARVAGYYTRGEGAQIQRFGYFYLAVERGDDGMWRIAAETSAFPGPVRLLEPIDAAQLVSRLDDAGIQRAVVLSDAFLYGSRSMPAGIEESSSEARHSKVRAENDWVAAEVAKFPQRLIAFCSLNPLESYAMVELERCTRGGRMRGLKLHFTESRVDLRNSQHVEAVRQIFAAANARRLPIVVHVGADATHAAANAQTFLERILIAAPDVTVQLAHLWGGELFSDAALAVYARAVGDNDPRTRNLYFDVAEVALMVERAGDAADEARTTVVARIRQIGVQRILFGSDDHVAPRQAWAAFRSQFPLTSAEHDAIANNIAPYLR
ncbi:MAG TPA: amidohydrolase family protein [Steroidobacteraceae bacterium]|nr:amidohydrolase family protein [Steroidobacteraceae bacterium]